MVKINTYKETKAKVEAYLKLKYKFDTFDNAIAEVQEIFNTPFAMSEKIVRTLAHKGFIIIENGSISGDFEITKLKKSGEKTNEKSILKTSNYNSLILGTIIKMDNNGDTWIVTKLL